MNFQHGLPAPARRSAKLSMRIAHSIGLISFCVPLCLAGSLYAAESPKDPLRLPDKPIPLQPIPGRPAPPVEFGDPFFGASRLRKPFVLPTGAVWSPSLFFYGSLRSALQDFDDGNARRKEWANRLDLFGNVQLAATERILVGFRPIDRFDGRVEQYSGYIFEPRRIGDVDNHGLQGEFKDTPTTLFFEGELSGLFPKLESSLGRNLDYGISVGRQPLLLQDGVMANDDMLDFISVTRNSLLLPSIPDLKLSGFYGWSQVKRNDMLKDVNADLAGVDALADFADNTVQADALYLNSHRDADVFNAGIGSTQRPGELNSTVRLNASVAPNAKTFNADNGVILTSELSRTMPGGDNIAYLNGFWAIDQFTSADRSPTTEGPLSRVGVLFTAVGLGRYDAPLNNDTSRAAGGVAGYQYFFDVPHRRQIIFEFGGRTAAVNYSTLGRRATAGAAVRYQQVFGQHIVTILDGYSTARAMNAVYPGIRAELLVKF